MIALSSPGANSAPSPPAKRATEGVALRKREPRLLEHHLCQRRLHCDGYQTRRGVIDRKEPQQALSVAEDGNRLCLEQVIDQRRACGAE